MVMSCGRVIPMANANANANANAKANANAQANASALAIAITLTLALGLTAAAAFAADEPPASRRMDDGKQWMTTNLSVKTDGSYCYGDMEENCRKYGRLYTWDAAQKACPSLGAGWRLPTDAEWRELARQYGAVSVDDLDKGKPAYAALMVNGRSGFNAVLGGNREPEGTYARGEAHGFYWTSTSNATDPTRAIFYNFGRGGQALHRQPEGEKTRAFSVRCIKD